MGLRFLGGNGLNLGSRRGGFGFMNGGLSLPYSIDFSTLADGPLPWPWAGSTWAISGGKAVNTPVGTGELVPNGGFDTDTSGWVTSVAAIASVAGGQSGNCLQVTNSGAAFGWSRFDPMAVISAGAWYICELYFKKGTDNGHCRLGTTSGGTEISSNVFSDANWGRHIVSFRSPGTALSMRLGIESNVSGHTTLFDSVTCKALSLPQLLLLTRASTPDVTLSAALIRTPVCQAGLVINADSATSPANFVIVYLDGAGNLKTDKCVAGSYTNIPGASGAVTYGADKVIKVVKSGTSYDVYYGTAGSEAQVGTTQTISDAGIVNNTLHGLFSTNAGNSFSRLSITKT